MARIVAVADCFDAITTDRPYQKGYEPRYASEVITKLAGSRFDAKVVTAFLRAYEVGDLAGRAERRHAGRAARVRAAGGGQHLSRRRSDALPLHPGQPARRERGRGRRALPRRHRRDASTSRSPSRARTRCGWSAPTSASTCARWRQFLLVPRDTASRAGCTSRRTALHLYAVPLPDGYYLVLVQRAPALAAAARRSPRGGARAPLPRALRGFLMAAGAGLWGRLRAGLARTQERIAQSGSARCSTARRRSTRPRSRSSRRP